MDSIDQFNWADIDTFLAREAIKGNHSYIQVNIDPTDGTTDIPDYLVSKVDWEYTTWTNADGSAGADVENVRPEFAMTESNKTLIANAYKSAFPDVHLLARYAENMPNPQDFGYSDGLFFGQSILPFPWHFYHTLELYNAEQNWKSHPIGGEIDPGKKWVTLFK